MTKRTCIAKIATAHGIRGLVKLHVFADDTSLAVGNLFTSETGDATLHITLKNATAKHWLAEVGGVKDRTQAEALRGTELYIPQDALPEPEEGEFYISDLIGLSCVDAHGGAIGEVIAVENYGASDLLEIAPISGAETFYLPFNDDTILDIQDDKIMVEIPEGLLDA